MEKSADQSTLNLNAKTYRCESCGNFLHYDPDTKTLKCTHCGSQYPLAEVPPAEELAYTDNSECGFVDWGEEVKSIQCKSCGAVSVLDKYQTALKCPFCGAPNIAEIDDVPGLKPNAVLPFAVSDAAARGIYAKWLKKRWLAPLKLRKEAKTQGLNGIYIPCFTFDCNTSTDYQIRYGQHYTVRVGSGKNARTETRTRWYVDRGCYNSLFDDVQIEASTHLSQENLRKLGGFDTGNSVRYHSQFVAGYTAERYDQGLDQSWQQATEQIKGRLKEQIVSRYRADVVDYVKMNTSYSNRTYKYALVPLWLLNYRYNKKDYGCVINGRNRRVMGKYPKSPWKVGTVTIVCAALAAGLIYLIMRLLG